MAETKSPVNRAWMSVRAGEKYGPGFEFFAGGENPGEVITAFAAAFGPEATDQAIGSLMSVLATDMTKAAVGNLKQGGMVGGNQGGSSVPASEAWAQGMTPPVCNHGPMVPRSGTNARGQWRGWMCDTPKGAPDKCKAQYL